MQRNNKFGARCAVACDMPAKRMHVLHKLRFVFAYRRAAYAARDRDLDAGGLALKRPEDQRFAVQKIEPCPVEIGHGVHDQGGQV